MYCSGTQRRIVERTIGPEGQVDDRSDGIVELRAADDVTTRVEGQVVDLACDEVAVEVCALIAGSGTKTNDFSVWASSVR